MNVHARKFVAKPAVRESVPLLIGLMGPSGSGKTYSALRLATGIQKVTGGDIFCIDTEARRALHYSDMFKFKHVQFDAPFGSLDYLAALQHCVNAGGRVVIVDSMSHEHEGPGGLLDLHEQELDRLAGDDYAKRERMKMLAWQKPKAHRRLLINGLLQLNANFVFCFRAKQTAKPVKNPQTGKIEIVSQGFMPIAGDEFLFEQTVNCLLLPNSGGIPTWNAENVGERLMIKLPQQFKTVFTDNRPLDEEHGTLLARWARGSVPKQQHAPASDAASSAASVSPSPHTPEAGAATSHLPDMTWAQYSAQWDALMADENATGRKLSAAWKSPAHKALRDKIEPTDDEYNDLLQRVKERVAVVPRG